MFGLVTYKNEDNNIIQLYFSRPRVALSVIGSQVWQYSNTFKFVLVTCKNKEDPFINEGARVATTDLSL